MAVRGHKFSGMDAISNNDGITSADGSVLRQSERTRAIFNRIVGQYLETGLPVGSKTIAASLENTLSSASVRSIMADLEKAGLLFQPHISAGRVPTDSGLRLFVNGLMEIGGEIPQDVRAVIDLNCRARDVTVDEALAQTTTLLSGLSHCASLVVMPKEDTIIRHIEFTPLTLNRALVVLVSDSGQVENRIIDTPRGLPPSALIEAGNFITTHLAGHSLSHAATILEKTISDKQTEIDKLSQNVVAKGIAVWSARESGQGNLIIKGHANLLDNVTEIEELDKIRNLFALLEEQNNAKDVLAMIDNADGVQIFIGAENRLFKKTDCSMIIASYKDSNNTVVGAVGVIGPTRLNYARIIPMVNYTSKMVSEMLKARR